MKSLCAAVLLGLTVTFSGNAGVIPGGQFHQLDENYQEVIDNALRPDGNMWAYAEVSGYAPSLEAYELTLKFTQGVSADYAGYLGGSVLVQNHASPYQSFNLTDLTPSSDRLTWTGTYSPGDIGAVNPNSTWTLSLFNTSNPGDTYSVAEWSLGITAVPEPANVALGVFGGIFGLAIIARSRAVRNRVSRWKTAAAGWINAV